MKTILAILCLAAVSCAPVIKKVSTPIISAPLAVPYVTPLATSAQQASAATGVVSAKLEGQVASLKVSTANLRDGMQSALKEVDRLREAKTATELELAGLWTMMDASNKKVNALVADMETAQNTAAEQSLLRAKAETEITALLTVAAAKDAEVETLRLQHKDLNKLLQDKAKESDDLRARVTTAEKSAAVGSYLKWVIGIMGLLLFLAAAGIVYLKFFFRPLG